MPRRLGTHTARALPQKAPGLRLGCCFTRPAPARSKNEPGSIAAASTMNSGSRMRINLNGQDSSATAAVRPPPPPRQSAAKPSPGIARLVLQDPPAGKTFSINDAAATPHITAQAKITGVTPDPTAQTTFTWTISVTFNALVCNHGPARQINPPADRRVYERLPTRAGRHSM